MQGKGQKRSRKTEQCTVLDGTSTPASSSQHGCAANKKNNFGGKVGHFIGGLGSAKARGITVRVWDGQTAGRGRETERGTVLCGPSPRQSQSDTATRGCS